MQEQNNKYIIDKEKLSLLKIKLILECGELIHHNCEHTDPFSVITAEYMKNYHSTLRIDKNNKIEKKDGKELHCFTYDEYIKSFIVGEIEKLLNDDLSTIDNIKEEFFTKKEEKYKKEVLSCIKIKEKMIGEK